MTNQKLPILFTNDFFLFPHYEESLLVESYEKAVLAQAWKKSDGYLLIIPDKPAAAELAEYSQRGILAEIILDLSSEVNSELIINSLQQIKLCGLERIKLVNSEKKNGIHWGKYEILFEKKIFPDKMDELKEKFLHYFSDIQTKAQIPTERLPQLTVIKGNLGNFIDFIAQHSKEIDELTKWGILVSSNLEERLELLINTADKKQIDRKVEAETRVRIKRLQDEYYLREKLKVIRRKLGELGDKREGKSTSENGESQKNWANFEKKSYPEYVKKKLREEINRYNKMATYSTDANLTEQYIDYLLELPWRQKSPEAKGLGFARQKLAENHHGLTEIKQRIIEHLAVQEKAGELAGQIICFVGPPGVGKTSLASSIAEATGRKFLRISMGGMRDVAEIQGHRRTYIGAMPGQIIQAMKEAQVINPLLLIDEIDKVERDFRSNPVHALLLALDPQQNKKFIDTYLGNDVPYDLSQVMFICTANQIWNLPRPLLDRMEIIQLCSYTENEKFHIAKEHLIPENLAKHNLTSSEMEFQDEAIKDIIKYYTHETGVRELNRKIQTIVRKFVLQMAEEKLAKVVITSLNLVKYLKKRTYEHTLKQKRAQRGVATGLAWTEVGGDILLIEVSYSPGKGELTLTGNLGDIMKESTYVSLAYVKTNYQKFSLDPTFFSKNDINIHVPEGATPKEGPSAGIALTSAIISALTGKTIPGDLGMTGEITLHGHIGEIGGLKEKAIAAQRSGLKTIIIPKANEKDEENIPPEVRDNLNIIKVEKYDEVWKKIFAPKKNRHQKILSEGEKGLELGEPK